MHNQLKRLCAVMLLVIVTVVAIPNAQPTQVNAQTEEYKFLRSWGGEGNKIIKPYGLALSPDEKKLYFTSVDLGQLRIINKAEQSFTVLGEPGGSPIQFSSPSGIAIDRLGNIFVADTMNYRIQKFSHDGNFITSWGSQGEESGQFKWVDEIVVDNFGFVYACDGQQNRIQKFTNDGVFVKQWSAEALGIAIDQLNNIYTVGGNIITKYTDEGIKVQQFTGQIQGIGISITVDLFGNIFIVDFDGFQKIYKIVKLNSNGSYIAAWKVDEASSHGILISDSSGNIYYSDRGNNRILEYSNQGYLIYEWGNDNQGNERTFSPFGIVANDKVYITDQEKGRVVIFSKNGSFIHEWRPFGIDNHFLSQAIMVIDQTNNFYIYDSISTPILKLNSNGSIINQFGSAGSGDGQISNPGGMAISPSGKLFISDNRPYVPGQSSYRVQVFSSDGSFIENLDNSMFTNSVHGVATDRDGNIYVASSASVYKYSPNGEMVGSIGTLSGAYAIAIDQNTNLFVSTVTYGQKISKYSYDGNLIAQFGNYGQGAGEFNWPSGLAVDNSGYVFVADSRNYRVDVFSPHMLYPDLHSGLIQNGSFEEPFSVVDWATGGKLSTNLSTHAIHGNNSLLLGLQVGQSDQRISQAWAHQTIFVDPEWSRPVLSFKYNLFVNDIMDYSDFFVEIQDGVGLNHLATVVRDGYQPCTPGAAPVAGTDLGWRTKTYDLSAYKGQYIRIVFSNRNLWPESWGIWTYVDDVRVIDAGPLPLSTGSVGIFLPLVTSGHCDPVPMAGISATTRFLNQP